jgi:hypothetical protein
MMTNHCRKILTIILIALQPCDAITANSLFQISGFGTLGVVHSNEQQADFIGSYMQKHGAGRTDHWSFAPDSRVGMQINAPISNQLEGTVQLVSQLQYDGTIRPEVEWANLKYSINPDLTLRGGRFALPISALSDARLVGYAYPWIRPPQELYESIAFTRVDGTDVVWRTDIKDSTLSIRALYGDTTQRFPDPQDLKVSAKSILSAIATFEYRDLTLKAIAVHTRVSLTSPGIASLANGYRQFINALQQNPGLQAIAGQTRYILTQHAANNIKMNMVDVSVHYERRFWFAQGEYLHEKSEGILANLDTAYLSLGYRYKALTPYFILSYISADKPVPASLPVDQMPAPLADQATQLTSALNSYLIFLAPRAKTSSLGVRWDFLRSADLKLQWDHTQNAAGSAGLLSNLTPEFTPGRSYDLIGLALDFVF